MVFWLNVVLFDSGKGLSFYANSESEDLGLHNSSIFNVIKIDFTNLSLYEGNLEPDLTFDFGLYFGKLLDDGLLNTPISEFEYNIIVVARISRVVDILIDVLLVIL